MCVCVCVSEPEGLKGSKLMRDCLCLKGEMCYLCEGLSKAYCVGIGCVCVHDVCVTIFMTF